MEGIGHNTDVPPKQTPPAETTAPSEAFSGSVDETMLCATDASALSDVPPQRPEDTVDDSPEKSLPANPEVDLHAVAGKLATAPSVEGVEAGGSADSPWVSSTLVSQPQQRLHALTQAARAEGVDVDAIAARRLTPKQQEILPRLLAGDTLSGIAADQGVTAATMGDRVHTIWARLSTHPVLESYVPPATEQAVMTSGIGGESFSTLRQPRLEAIREAKDVDLTLRGEPPRRWGSGQPARIIVELQERGFDVAGTIPVEMVSEKQVVQLLSEGMSSKEVARETGLSQARIAYVTSEIVDYIHYVTPRELLPPDLPKNYFYPTGSFMDEVDTSAAGMVAGRLKEIVANSGKSVAELSEILGTGWSEATIYNVISGRTLPTANRVRGIVQAAGDDPEESMSEYDVILRASKSAVEQGGEGTAPAAEIAEQPASANVEQQSARRRWAPNQPRHILQHLHEVGFDVAPFMRITKDAELSSGDRRLLEALLSNRLSADIAAQTSYDISAITRLAERMVVRIAEHAKDHTMPEGITPEFFEPKGTPLNRTDEVSPASVAFVLQNAIAERGIVEKDLAAELHISPSQLTRILRRQRMPIWTIKTLIDRLFGDNPEYAHHLHQQSVREAADRHEKMKGT